MKKPSFERYIIHLQKTLFRRMGRVAFNRQLIRGLSKGEPAMMKLYADVTHMKKEKAALRVSRDVDDAAIDRLLEDYRDREGAKFDAAQKPTTARTRRKAG